LGKLIEVDFKSYESQQVVRTDIIFS